MTTGDPCVEWETLMARPVVVLNVPHPDWTPEAGLTRGTSFRACLALACALTYGLTSRSNASWSASLVFLIAPASGISGLHRSSRPLDQLLNPIYGCDVFEVEQKASMVPHLIRVFCNLVSLSWLFGLHVSLFKLIWNRRVFTECRLLYCFDCFEHASQQSFWLSQSLHIIRLLCPCVKYNEDDNLRQANRNKDNHGWWLEAKG